MPTYSYSCNNCKYNFEMFFHIKDYVEKPKCTKCKSKNTSRRYLSDVLSQFANVRKSDSELNTIGDLAKRNSDRLSDDEKHHLYLKHNSYKHDQTELKDLPQGMSRITKPQKSKWPGSKPKVKRKRNG